MHFIENDLLQIFIDADEDDSVIAFLNNDMIWENVHHSGHLINDSRTVISITASTNKFTCSIVLGRASAYHDMDALFRFDIAQYKRNRAEYETDGDVEFVEPYKNLGVFTPHSKLQRRPQG